MIPDAAGGAEPFRPERGAAAGRQGGLGGIRRLCSASPTWSHLPFLHTPIEASAGPSEPSRTFVCIRGRSPFLRVSTALYSSWRGKWGGGWISAHCGPLSGPCVEASPAAPPTVIAFPGRPLIAPHQNLTHTPSPELRTLPSPTSCHVPPPDCLVPTPVHPAHPDSPPAKPGPCLHLPAGSSHAGESFRFACPASLGSPIVPSRERGRAGLLRPFHSRESGG